MSVRIMLLYYELLTHKQVLTTTGCDCMSVKKGVAGNQEAKQLKQRAVKHQNMFMF